MHMRTFKDKRGNAFVTAEFRVRQEAYDAYHAAATMAGLTFSDWARRILDHHAKPGKPIPTSIPKPVPTTSQSSPATLCERCARIGRAVPACTTCNPQD